MRKVKNGFTLIEFLVVFSIISLLISIDTLADNIWTGFGSNSNWNTAANWQEDSIPGLNSGRVYLTPGTSHDPYITDGINVEATEICLPGPVPGVTIDCDSPLSTLTMDGGALTTGPGNGNLLIGHTGPGYMNLSGGTIHLANTEGLGGLWVGVHCRGTLEMTDGTIYAGGEVKIPLWEGVAEGSIVNLRGGRIYSPELSIHDSGTLNICAGGAFILQGNNNVPVMSNAQSTIDDYIANGRIIACNGLSEINVVVNSNGNQIIMTARSNTKTWTGMGSSSNWDIPENWLGCSIPDLNSGRVYLTPGTFQAPYITDGINVEATEICLPGPVPGVVIDCNSPLSTLTMDGGTLTTGPGNGNLLIGHTGPGYMNLSGGTIHLSSTGLVGGLWVGIHCPGTLEMTGGIIYAGGEVQIPFWEGIAEGSIVNLRGGTIYSPKLVINSTGTLNICDDGTFVLQGNNNVPIMPGAVSAIGNYIANSRIIANSGYSQIDMQINDSGNQIVLTASPFLGMEFAWNPYPVDGAVGVSSDVIVSWSSGEYAVSHDIYFGTDFEEVSNAARLSGDIDGSGGVDLSDVAVAAEQWLTPTNSHAGLKADLNNDGIVDAVDFSIIAANWKATGNGIFKGNHPLEANSYDPEDLEPDQTYYWRIDEVNDSYPDSPWKGKVWTILKPYKWLDATQIEVPEDWNPNAWYRMEAAPGIEYDLSAAVVVDSDYPAEQHEILTSGQASEVEQFAARELQKYLFRITGMYLPVVTQSNSSAWCLSVGNHLDSRLAGRNEDNFVMVSSSGQLILSGAGDRGTLYSVYTFLEKYLGCRWYYPDPEDEIIPKMNLSDVDYLLEEGVDEFCQPAMEYRELMILNQDGVVPDPSIQPGGSEIGGGQQARAWLQKQLIRTAYTIDWCAKNRYNTVVTEGSLGGMHVLTANWDLVKTILAEISKRGLRLGIGGHFWTPYLNSDTTAGWPSDNSWGPFGNGQRYSLPLCSHRFFCTTNYDAITTFLKETVSFFRANPEFDIWANWPPDGTGNVCECSVCSLFSSTHRIVRLHNQIADALETEALRMESPISGKKIPVILIGYGNQSNPPLEPIPLHPYFSIMPDIYRDFSVPYSSGGAGQWKSYLMANGTSDNKLIMFGRWCRSIFTGYHLLPPPTISDTIRNMISEGFSGAEGFVGWGGWWLKGLWVYANGKALWDPDSISVSSLSDEYFSTYFDSAAEPMRTFYEANEQAHADYSANFVYCNNYDLWWSAPGCIPYINPYEDRAFPGILSYLDTMLSVSPIAERCFADAKLLVAGRPDEARLLERIRKAEISWEYFEHQKRNHKYQFDGLLCLEQGYNAAAGMAEYIEKLDEAQQAFELSQQHWHNYEQMVQDYTMLHNDFSADLGVFWDGGTTASWAPHYDYSGKWLNIVQQLRNEAQGQSWPFSPRHPWVQHYPEN